jgi:dephospho-CoA kinase
MAESPHAPLQIGITGGIGSGKSIVCRVFACLGVSIYDADARAKWLTSHDSAIKSQVTELLGVEAYDENGQYNRPFVASKVFANEPLLKSLNAIIHPVVFQDTERWIAEKKGEPYIIKEAALMKAAGDGNTLDYVIVVQAPEAIRIQRILQRDKRSEEEIRSIIARQVSDETRAALADFTILNDGAAALIPQVLDLHKQLMNFARASTGSA